MPAARIATIRIATIRIATVSIAALLGPLALAACSDDTASDDTASDGGAACVTDGGSATAGPITIEILAPATCDGSQSGIVRVTNAGELSCSSNFNAIVAGNRLAFTSESGFGGEIGSWGPIAESEPDPVGVIEYPKGSREWPVLLPDDLSGDLNWSIAAIDCGSESYPFSIDFSAA